ncbi:MAG: endopeptidase La, partial [Desulfatiglandales bacterium]
LPQELLSIAKGIEQPGTLADMVISVLNLDILKKQEILETLDVKERLKKASLFLNEEAELLRISKKIQDEVRKGIDKSQKEYYLREQLRVIQRELGLEKEVATEVEELRAKLLKKNLPEHVMKAAEEELSRLGKMSPSSPEYMVSRTYLQWILDLPWTQSTKDHLDLRTAERVLNKHHYDLEKVKKRILEFLAVRKLNPNHKGPILCLVGPPGTGKTSLGRSIAEALGRRFVRVSLGGVRDEAEIRGHRRTYIGSLPGRIIQGMKKAGSNNPVFMLDEVDKIGLDFRGDPASALLEVLDPEQNVNFSDHYLELEFDLSKVIFIATANHLDPIPPALRDRMEVLELSGYTEEEKLQIAQRFIIPRQREEHGLTPDQVKITPGAIKKIIRNYTREAGVRNLEREIASIMRSVAKDVAAEKKVTHEVTQENLSDYLGKPKYTFDQLERSSKPGVAVGLAWTPTGGDILFVEATLMPGKKELVLTGQLGDVMKESARTALSYLKSNYSSLGLSETLFGDYDIHVHVPAGAVPKDGPSAGITLLTALASLFKAKPIRPKLAMTGEVTLRGIVLPVGGIKEKVLAAIRSGVKEVIIPYENKKDLEEIPKKIISQIKVHLAKDVSEVLKIALDGS